MFEIMGRHYDQIKEQVGLKDAIENSDDDDEQTEAIFRKLRPHSKYRFSEVLKYQEKDPKKAIKMIGPMGFTVKDQ